MPRGDDGITSLIINLINMKRFSLQFVAAFDSCCRPRLWLKQRHQIRYSKFQFGNRSSASLNLSWVLRSQQHQLLLHVSTQQSTASKAMRHLKGSRNAHVLRGGIFPFGETGIRVGFYGDDKDDFTFTATERPQATSTSLVLLKMVTFS
jgi:hypothetical protein